MTYKHFFWDYDGTLFDSYPCMTRAFLKGLKDLGISYSYDALYALEKVSLRHAGQVIGEQHGVEVKVIMELYHKYYLSEGYEAMKPYEGVRELLQASLKKGGKHYLYTHRGKSSVEALEYYQLDKLFTDFVTAEHHFPSKPSPDALNYLMQKHGLSKDECVMLGDRDIDVQAGMNAGMAGVLFDPDGFYDGFDADYRFKTMDEIRIALVQAD